MSKILIIDDDADLSAVMKGTLEKEGYHVILASDGKAGLTQARKEKPDLIFLDVMMPVMDGFLFADEFNRDVALAKIPVIAVTSYVESPLGRPVPFQVTDYVNKPVRPAELGELVKKNLKQKT